MEGHRLMTVPRIPFAAILHLQGLPQRPTLTCPTFPFSESSELILSFLEGVSLHFLKVLLLGRPGQFRPFHLLLLTPRPDSLLSKA